MAGSYLLLAYKILAARSRPMTAQEIMEDAKHFDALPKHLYGETKTKTLQARIAEDIDLNRETTKFYRTGQGRYFLRHLSQDPTLHQNLIQEFSTTKREKPHSSDRLLYIDTATVTVTGKTKIISEIEFRNLAARSRGYFSAGKQPVSFSSVSTLSIIKNGTKYLNFNIGRHTNFPDLIGQKCIGFRRTIDEYDLDLFINDELGFVLGATREVMKNIASSKVGVDDRDLRTRAKLLFVALQHQVSRITLVLQFDISEIVELEGNLISRHGVTKPIWTDISDLHEAKLEPISQLAVSKL